MITYDLFERTINFIKRQVDFECQMADLFREYKDIVGDERSRMNASGVLITEILEEVFEQPIYDVFGSDISWWIWECDCGRDVEKIKNVEDPRFPEDSPFRKPDLSTTRGFYDYLIACMVLCREE